MLLSSARPSAGLRRMFARLALGVGLFAACVTPGAAQIFGGSDGDAQRRLAEMTLRITQMEGQLRQANGQIEQLQFQVRQLNDLVQRQSKDNEARFQDLESAGGRRPAAAAPVRKSEVTVPAEDPGRPAVAAAAPIMAGGAPAASAPRPGPGAPPQVLGQISSKDGIGGVISGASAPLDLAGGRSSVAIADDEAEDPDAPPGVNLGPAAPRPMTSQAKTVAAAPPPAARPQTDHYDSAYALFMNGDYERSEAEFRQFLKENPTDKRAASAQYWLGESLLSRKMHREAAAAFLDSYRQYPDSPKAPDSLLKLGISLKGMGEMKAACASFDEVLAKYPKASRALRDLATAERSVAKCA